ncbi:MAG: hypothetical protein HUU15_06375 [Candidatus Brocadiae bacterium]|nr:hypothetical protein [Candidatus Brocadiia bacterium]
MAANVPDWAPSFEEPLYREFIGAVFREMEARGQKAVETLDGVRFRGKIRRLGPLAEVCRFMPVAQWKRAVGAYFDRVERADAALQEYLGRADLADTRAKLRIRMASERSVTEAGADLCSKPVAPGLVATLVLGTEAGAAPVTAAMAEGWGVPTEALFEGARANHKRRKPRREGESAAQILVVAGADLDHATEVLFMDHYVPLEPSAGTLLIVPNRRTLAWHEIHDMGVLQAIETLVVIGYQIFQEGSEPVLPVLYWYRRRRFAMLPLEIQGQNVRFMPPIEFVAALKKIGVDLAE